MKRIILIIMLIVLAISCLQAVDGSDGFNWKPLILLAGTILTPILAQLTGKLFKKLNIDIDTTTLEAAFSQAWSLIAEAEMKFKKGLIQEDERKKYVIDRTYSQLSKKVQKVVEKRFGSVANFVEAAFQSSAISRKTSKN